MARDGNMRADYALLNAYALVDEVSEAMDEIAWKPWAVNRGTVNRDLMVGELVDAAHFMANLLTMLGVTDEEWARRYEEKQQRNARRQGSDGGYDSKQDKCPHCKRELDKEGALTVSDATPDVKYVECATCHAVLAVIRENVAKWDEDVIIKNTPLPGTIHK